MKAGDGDEDQKERCDQSDARIAKCGALSHHERSQNGGSTQYQESIGDVGADDIAPGDRRRSGQRRLDAGNEFGHRGAEADNYQPDDERCYPGAFGEADRSPDEKLAANKEGDKAA